MSERAVGVGVGGVGVGGVGVGVELQPQRGSGVQLPNQLVPLSNQLHRLLSLDWAFAFALFALTFTLCVLTVAPTVLDQDQGEFQTNIYNLGVSHTGYPLYFLLAKLWTLVIPFGNVAYRANLFSAFVGALAAALIYATMRALNVPRVAAIFPALLFGVSRVEWSQALIADVYTLNAFFIVLVTLLMVLWCDGRVPLTVPVFAYGLSLTHHRTMLWFAPAMIFWILWRERLNVFRPANLLRLLIAFVLPLLFYLYIPLRGDSDIGTEFHLRQFSDMIGAGNAFVWLRFGPFGFLIERVTQVYLPLMLEQFTPVGFLLGLFGMVILARGEAKARELLVFLLLAHLTETAFGIVFWVVDSEIFFIPSYLTFLFFVGIGIAALFKTRASKIITAFALSAVVVFLAVTNYPRVDMSNRDDVAGWWQDAFTQPIEQDAIIVGPWESLTPLEYFQYVEHRRTDLQRLKVVIHADQLALAPGGDHRAEIEKMIRRNQPVYFTIHPAETETLAALAQTFRWTRVGGIWHAIPQSSIPLKQTVGADFGGVLDLDGFTLTPANDWRAGQFALVSLFWRAAVTTPAHYKISLRLLDDQQRIWYQRDQEPASGLRPTNTFASNETVQDDEGIIVPPDAPAGDYHLVVLLYDAATGKDLGTALELATVSVSAPDKTYISDIYNIPHKISDPNIVGFGLDRQDLKGGDEFELSLWWQNTAAQNFVVMLGTTPLFAGTSPSVSVITRGRYNLLVPVDQAPGESKLSLAMNGRTIELGTLQVKPSGRLFAVPAIPHAQYARLGDTIELLGYDVDKTTVRPGDTIKLTLYWHALKPTDASYTVFTHLLDANGFLRAQKDSVPHNGELPINRWLAGEYVVDEYEMTIPSDAPEDDYRFEVGMYDAATSIRVSATDSAGARLQDNRVLFADVKVAR